MSHGVTWYEDVGFDGDDRAREAPPHGSILVLGVLGVQGGHREVMNTVPEVVSSSCPS